MAEMLTPQQKEAVVNRGGPLLVSAAAGSGKTKVLVDRLLRYITDPSDPANIDDFLIITYTKAAAAELRGKIGSKIAEQIAMQPENRHLQQQMQRLYLAKISTVHSFCSDILHEYAYQLDIPADFRVADENECIELQIRAIRQVLDDAYADESNSDFYAFVDSQGFGRDDRQIPEIILKVHSSAMCHLNPNQWLDRCVSSAGAVDMTDASQTVWGKYLIDDLHKYLDLQIHAMQQCADRAAASCDMDKPAQLLAATADQLRLLRNCQNWDQILAHNDIDYGRLTFSKKCTDLQLIDQIKAVREACKKGITAKLRSFIAPSTQVLNDLTMSISAVRGLIVLVKAYDSAYKKLKNARHIVDFSDLEHLSLDLFRGKNRTTPTRAAEEVGSRFREVMVDEYQDSNQVQDSIFSALTAKRHNCFMVGDVKQSIYQFRLADPEIFIEKYNTYLPAASAIDPDGRKVLLSSNFRSSGGVIRAVNDVFSLCMSEDIGGLVYGESEQLNEGVPHIDLPEPEVELYGIDVQEDTYAEESEFVADRIAQLLDGSHMVRDGEKLRPITPEDIVILMRSPGSVGGEFRCALEKRGIRCATGGGADILQSEEIEVLTALLQVIDNPLQDIPLLSVLLSRVIGFTADELASLRAEHRHGSIYDAIRHNTSTKAVKFLSLLEQLRKQSQLNTVSGLLNKIIALTRIDSIYAAMPDGEIRLENLQYFCQMASAYESAEANSLKQFLRHLDVLGERGLSANSDSGAAGAVTIMSIHKSKGLEFPVVFLSCLSRSFNQESARAQVLCDKELGLGLSCVDTVNRVRYPSVAKKAISAKIVAQGISEEMRVLYVAMTRARDRLIMTYAVKNLEDDIADLSLRSGMCNMRLLTGDVTCPGEWVLLTALQKHAAGWHIQPVTAPLSQTMVNSADVATCKLSDDTVSRIRTSLAYTYPHKNAISVPSKQTATQLKGRIKDSEVAENTGKTSISYKNWRKPMFESAGKEGKDFGNLLHTIMQHIAYTACRDLAGTTRELKKLAADGYITQEEYASVKPEMIADFFSTSIGRALCDAPHVLREFKFSLLDDAEKYYPDIQGERILLQGVVDCAMIDPDGITVIDFKTDRVTEETLSTKADNYRPQICAYADALSRIYGLPIKSAALYFFQIGRFVNVI